jgi:hypothetical protein
MKQLLLFLLISIGIQSSVFAQSEGDQGYHSPLGIPLVLASNFGELRPNHFHMGLDFKTNSKIGYKLYSIDDGFVSRVKVSPYGYGHVIYIDHPNGITSVYGHCSEFKGEIDSIVRATQEAEQNFAIEVFPGKGVIKVLKGQVIGLSGNTGGSTGPHLHFEVRDTETEHALNPLVFGFDLPDSKAPIIRGVKVYGLTKDGYRYPNKSVVRTAVKGKSAYYVGTDKIDIPANLCSETGGIGIAFDVIDKLDGAGNNCGLYGSFLIVDGDTIFGQKTNRVPFESSRYVNSHKDYEAYQTQSKKYHKCFRTRENDLPIYINGELGIINAKPGQKLLMKYIAYDPKGNESVLEFTLNVLAGEINKEDSIVVNEDHLHPNETYLYESETRQLDFGYATVYEPVSLEKDRLENYIAKPKTPVNRAYRIKIRNDEPEDGRHYIEIITNKNRRRTLEVLYEDGWAIAESKYFGTYSLKRDEVAPVITPVSISQSSTSTSKTSLKWKISDAKSGIEDYDLFIDGKWYLLKYDYKARTITFERPADLKGKKELVLKVKDSCGNVKEWKTEINFI